MPLPLIYQFDVTIPAGTSQSSPLVTSTTFEPNVVDSIHWLFPNGCNGMVGIQIGARSVPIIPSVGQGWIIRSGDSAGLDTQDMHTTGDWSLIGYNNGTYNHTVHITYRVHRNVKATPRLLLVAQMPRIVGEGES
jgi:hypothetical protein